MLNLYLLILFIFIQQSTSSIFDCSRTASREGYHYLTFVNNVCYLYMNKNNMKVQKTRKVYKIVKDKLLFRVVSGSGVSAYDYFSSSIIDDTTDGAGNYKSVLWHAWEVARPKLIIVTIRDAANSTLVNLKFQVNDADNVYTWFSLNNLISAYPFDLARMKGETYNFFSIEGNYHVNLCRRAFYINNNFDGCLEDKGYIAIIEMFDDCAYFNKGYFPVIVYTTGKWLQFKEGKYFDIIGQYDADVYELENI